MKARLVKFGEIEVEGKRYTHDVVIDGGKVRKRKKGPSKQFREKFGHTPLSAGEGSAGGGTITKSTAPLESSQRADAPTNAISACHPHFQRRPKAPPVIRRRGSARPAIGNIQYSSAGR
jgi:hypothetical protein